MRIPIMCPYCSSIDNNGRVCHWCGNPVTEYESEEKTMTIEMKFTGLTPEQALRLIKAASETPLGELNPPSISGAAVSSFVPTVSAVSAQPAAVAAANPIAPPAAPPVAAVPTAPVPTAVKQYTTDELAVAARPVCELPGGRDKLLELLHSFTYTDKDGAVKQVQSIMDVPQELYPALANGIRQLGGRI